MNNQKFKIILIFYFIIQNAFSQNYVGEVVYDHIFENGQIDLKKEYVLSFDKGLSIYVENIDLGDTKSAITLNKKNNFGTYNIKSKSDKKHQFYLNYKIRDADFYFGERIMGNRIIVKENKNLYSWNLKDSIKTIGRYSCKMATTTFRGRDYIAWYTDRIPVSYGPWKMHGLPGLILEIYDTSLSFRATAKSIAFKENENNATFELEDFIGKVKLEKSLSIEEMVNYVIKENQIMLDRINSRMPKGSTPLKLNNNCKDCGQNLETFNE